jgi:hypothetical protein
MLTPKQKAAKEKALTAKKKVDADLRNVKRRTERAKAAEERRIAAEKEEIAELGLIAPMTKFDFDYCDAYIQLGKQAAAYTQVRPEEKDPRGAAVRMMKRPEIRDHIKDIMRRISRKRDRAAELSANAALLTLEVADDRLYEIMSTRRRSRGEMLTRDTKMLLVEGATPVMDDNGKIVDYELTKDLKQSLLEEGAPVEDADLMKAIKLTYDRRQGIIKAEKAPVVAFVETLLYKPKWYGGGQTIEGQA